jgi:Rrf2 family nitric oxide-sensitive transcriptional repressor
MKGREADQCCCCTAWRNSLFADSQPAKRKASIRLGDVVAMLEADQALVECFATGASTCTLTPQCWLKARLAHAEAAFVADLNRSTLADCVYRPEYA